MSKSFNLKKINNNFFTLFGEKTPAEIASLVGVGLSAVYSWKNGSKQVPWDKLALAKELSGKSWDWMLGADVASNQVEKQIETEGARLHLPPMADIPGPKGRRFTFAGDEIPTRGLAAADDSGGTRVPDTDDFGEPIHFPSGLIGIPVVGDSMSPVILSGQYVEVDIEREGFERDRGIYVVSVLEPDSVDDYPEPITGTFVKRCERHENLYYLESINGDYSPFSVHVDHCRIWPVLGVWFGGKGTPPEGF